jgi:predicted O-methyltransferase YrrM
MPKRFVDRGPELYDYLIAASSRESALKKELREATAKLPDARMQITPEQGQFMALLAKSIGAKRALEIGVFTGYSAWSVAEALPDDGVLVACDLSEEWTTIARDFWVRAGMASKIDLRIAPALETLAGLEAGGQSGAFDFAFIDADKENYDSYYEACLRLLRSGGLIVVDNALWGGQVMDPSFQDADTVSIRELNEKIRDDERVDATLLSVGDGVYLARKR